MSKPTELYQKVAGLLSCSINITKILDGADVPRRRLRVKRPPGVFPAAVDFHVRLAADGAWRVGSDYVVASGVAEPQGKPHPDSNLPNTRPKINNQGSRISTDYEFTEYMNTVEKVNIEVYEQVMLQLKKADELATEIHAQTEDFTNRPLALETQKIKAKIAAAWLNLLQIAEKLNEDTTPNTPTLVLGENIYIDVVNEENLDVADEDFHVIIKFNDNITQVRVSPNYTVELSETVGTEVSATASTDITHDKIVAAFGYYYPVYMDNKSEVIFQGSLLKDVYKEKARQSAIKRGV